MKRILISAMNSGSGKTVITCALLRALQRRGLQPTGVKCGPDYIDPMFQRRVLGISGQNLDVFLQGEEALRNTLQRLQGDIAVLEGAMGFFDGIGGTEQGSAWHIAELTDTPVLLVLKPTGVGVTLAAQVCGLMAFRERSHISGILLNACSPHLYAYLRPILERECGIPVLGYLPEVEEAVLESRHLGLVTADEVTDFEQRMDALAEQLEQHCDLDRILALCAEEKTQELSKGHEQPALCRIAVARDAAFCFYYQENLDRLRQAGAELVLFSPLEDRTLPDADGLYLGGGYPELYPETLSRNEGMKESIRTAIAGGMPVVAECGGFLYLQKTLAGFTMAGVFSGAGFSTERLQRFGYIRLHPQYDSLLFREGETVPAHEFHYWDCSENGTDLLAEKPGTGKSWSCGVCTETIYAGFPHLHFGGEHPLAERFAEAAVRYRSLCGADTDSE